MMIFNFSKIKFTEGMSEMKIEEKEIGVGELQKYPDRPGEPDCLYYLRTGSCGYGTNRRFNHPLLPPSKVFFLLIWF